MKTQFIIRNGLIEAVNVTRETERTFWIEQRNNGEARLGSNEYPRFDTYQQAKNEFLRQTNEEVCKLEARILKLRQVYNNQCARNEYVTLAILEQSLTPIDYEALNKAILSGEAFE